MIEKLRQWFRDWLFPSSAPVQTIDNDELLLSAAREIVTTIEKDPRHRAVVDREGNIQFCPRCGQKPASDYRKEEAFAMLYKKFPERKRSDLNWAIETAVREQA
jgi:hypothetical protein